VCFVKGEPLRRAAKVDLNHEEIVKVLRLAGCSVLSLAPVGEGVPDLLVYSPRMRRTFLAEVKNGAEVPSHRGLNAQQRAFADHWGGPIYVITSPIDALAAADGRGTTVEDYELQREEAMSR
jgi:hypothetical protein